MHLIRGKIADGKEIFRRSGTDSASVAFSDFAYDVGISGLDRFNRSDWISVKPYNGFATKYA
jgi:hypothetical protein